jgi:hypothetical protein
MGVIMEGLNLLNEVRYCTPMTIYLPVPAHLAYVAWVRVKQEQLAQLAVGPEHGRIEAARRMAHGADAEAVVTLVGEIAPGLHPDDGTLRVRMAALDPHLGEGGVVLLVPGLHGSGLLGSPVLAVGAGPSPDKARADLFERVAALLRVRQDGPDVTRVIGFPS